MFSTTQLEVIRPLVAEMAENGYTHYIAVTNSLTTVNNDYDIFIYFSKDIINAASAYKYEIQKGSLYYQIRSGSPSTTNQTARLQITPITKTTTLNINPYQWITTNSEFLTEYPLQPDLCQVTTVQGTTKTSVIMAAILIIYVAVSIPLQIIRRH